MLKWARRGDGQWVLVGAKVKMGSGQYKREDIQWAAKKKGWATGSGQCRRNSGQRKTKKNREDGQWKIEDGQ